MKTSRFHRIQGWGLSTYASLVWRTVRYTVRGQKHADLVRAAGCPLIIAAWHGMTMMLCGHVIRLWDPTQIMLVVPADSRGAVLSVWVRRMGATAFTISMQADSLVAARRLLALIRQLKSGKHLLLHPDGPDGPTHEPKKGLAFIARKAGAMILPVAAFTNAGYRLPRWDRYTVPLPFSRITVVLGEPLVVPPESDAEQARLLIRERLNEVERAAEDLYYAPSRSRRQASPQRPTAQMCDSTADGLNTRHALEQERE